MDILICAQAFEREHPADSDEPIDEYFLRSVATRTDHPKKWVIEREDAMPVGLWHVDDGWKAMLLHSEHAATCIVRGLKTRGDVRQLRTVLGINLTEPGANNGG